MTWYTPHLLLLNISSIISIALIVYAVRQRKAAGALPFAALMVCALIWSLGYFLEIFSSNFKTKVFWLNVQQIGIYGSSIAWLALALQYCGKVRWLHWRFMLPVSIIPFLAVLLIWTNDWHHLMRHDVYLKVSGQLSVVKTAPSLLTYSFIFYSYLLLFLSLFLFLTSYRRAAFPYRKQFFFLMTSLLLPMVTNILDLLGLNPFTPFGPTSTAFIISGLLIAWSLFRYQFFTLWPIARDKIIDEMQDGFIVTDTLGRIVDLNPAVYNILDELLENLPCTQMIGQPIIPILNAWPNWIKAYTALEEKHPIEIRLDSDVYYEVKISLLKSKKGAFIGHLTILHDITERKRIEIELFNQATTDSLTGIYNRRHFMKHSEQAFRTAVRYQKTISLIIIDIDNFKKINDTYGHMTGDIVLTQFAGLCKSLLRETDILGRFGGEEFAITLTMTTIDDGKSVV